MKTFNISGMDCDACVSLINMDLTDAGFGACVARRNPDVLNVPAEFIPNLPKIKEIVDGAGHYKLQLGEANI